MKPRLIYLLLGALILPDASRAGEALSAFSALHHAGLLVVDGDGRTVLAEQGDKAFIPASTTKLATAWLALTHWGEEHRFSTRFYYDAAAKTLWVKGSGDPYLVSEELELIATSLRQRGLTRIDAIGLDTGLFQPDLVLPGTGATDNPYDAVPSAVAANFNTVHLKKAGSRVVSAEPQTPLTAYAASFAGALQNATLRVNTGPNPRNAERYFAELLAAFMRRRHMQVGDALVSGRVPDLPVFYTHVNSKTLGEIVRVMLKYSTNFIANQLILTLSAETFQRPANAADVQRYMEQTLARRFGWQNFSLADGAGLSRSNRLSPQQLVELLQAFRNWKHLLPEVEEGVYAKTGTLTGVSTMAGYLAGGGVWGAFALMMNENVPYQLRNRIARELAGRYGMQSLADR
ncbi:MAG: D-alanyl-D-alanine carboxypeptidase/D-alanyl-D-alanine-endopeptidase [Gammaproteobacteria bacterium]